MTNATRSFSSLERGGTKGTAPNKAVIGFGSTVETTFDWICLVYFCYLHSYDGRISRLFVETGRLQSSSLLVTLHRCSADVWKKKKKRFAVEEKQKQVLAILGEKNKSHHSGCMQVKNPNIKASPLPKITQIPARSQRQLFPAHNWRVIVVESLCSEPQRLAQELCFWLAWVTAVDFRAVSPITAEEEHKWFSHRRVSSPFRPRSQSVFLWKCGQKKKSQHSFTVHCNASQFPHV